MLQTVANLLTQVERRSFAPADQTSFTEEEILTIASEELRSYIFPAIMRANEEYFVQYKDVSVVANQSGYVIPESAFNSTLREVQFVLSNQIYDLPRIPLEKVGTFANDGSSNIPSGFYLQGEKVHILPTPNAAVGTLRMYFLATTPQLVPSSSTAVISDINPTTNVVSVTTIPASWVTGDSFDFISKRAGHNYKAIDSTSTLVSGTDITFSSLPSDLAVGDYLAQTGESSLVQLPYSLIPVLAQYTAAALLDYGGQNGAAEAKKKADEMLAAGIASLTPRVIGEQVHIIQQWF